ncbi:MAG: GH116 family glycosyl hydrolase [Gemmatimonadota bacterium]|nr:GH116 family glycosyl hydrolase [Gemmatimonadota bacterium]
MRRVALVAGGAEGAAAAAWLATLPGLSVERVDALSAVTLQPVDLLWVHGECPPPRADLVPWLAAGGRLLLTLDAARLPALLGLEPVAPDERRMASWRHAEDEFWLDEYRSFLAFPHIRGYGAFGPHPLFAGLGQGTYVWAPSEGESYNAVAYHRSRPTRARIVAVERSFIHLNANRVLAWEQPVEEGGILCLGAYIHLAAPDGLLSRQLHVMLRNAVAGDAVPHATRMAPVSCWPGGREPADDAGEPAPAPPAAPGEPPSAMWDEWPPSSSPLLLESAGREDAPWTLAGRRVLVVGGERSGVQEIWVHPFRVLRQGHLLVSGREPDVVSARVTPDEVVRVLRVGEVELTERVSTALEHGLVVYSLVADLDLPLTLAWSCDFRRMWPYPAGSSRVQVRAQAAQSVRLGLSRESPELEVRAMAGGVELTGLDPRTGARLAARGRGRLSLVLAAGSDAAEADRALDSLARRKLRAVRQERILHARRLEERLTRLETPEPALDRAFGWAKVRLDSFLAETPGVGRSLLAGYGGSRPGWGDGRPGYAWYFGRDACWTAFATLAMGDREIAKDVLRFLARTRDVSGKIIHEYTTSGLAHYDAADSTPLFLLLAGRYAAWSGDLALLDRLWPAVLAAYQYCLETDTDGDGLIENQRVGHGWIEHGPLGGLRVTLYLAACWLAALEALAPVAQARGATALADELTARAARARAAIATRFRTPEGYALGLEASGQPRVHRTAMLAVPLLLGVIAPEDAAEWFDAVAAPGFSAPWGVRMIAADDPLFDPAGYHQGAVWPLYTGWVSLAEWRGGRWPAALAHLRANADLAEERARGAFDEVLHGLERRGAGICPDQAWSAAMVVSPAVEGLWGVVPDALAGAVRVAPWLPPDWSEMSLRGLRVGATTLDLRLRRRPGRVVLRVERTHGPRLRLHATLPGLPASAAVTLNDEPLGGGRAVFDTAERDEVAFVKS